MFVLSNVRDVYDGSSASTQALHQHRDILVDGERIVAVEPHNPARELGADVAVLDCSDYTLTPGLIDCHSHLTLLGASEKDLVAMDLPEGLLTIERILYTTLVDGGVTSARDVGGATHRIKRLVDDGVVIGPRLKIAICMLSTTGGHGDFRGPDRCHASLSKLFPEGPGRPSSIVDGPWECRKRVREIAACGADLIKICTSPGVLSPGDHLDHQEFTEEEIRAICEEARGRGMRVAAHAHSTTGVQLAIDNAVSDIQHISFMGEREVEAAYAAGCTVTPTSWIGHALHDEDGFSPFIQEKIKAITEAHASAVQHARSGGLKILMGTDPVLYGMHGRNYLELRALMLDGLSALEAWWGATGLAAAEIGFEDTGVIAAGRRADFLLCTGDVINHPERIGDNLVEVFKDGAAHRGAFAELAARGWRQLAHQSVRRDIPRTLS